jgi:hypothetical protein
VAEAPEPPPAEEPTEEPPPKGQYVRTTPEQIRDVVMNNGGPMTAQDVAAATGASSSSVRPKLEAWVEKGTMCKDAILVDGVRVHTYRIAGIDHPPYRAVRKAPKLRVVGSARGVAHTGKRNPKVMKRAGKIKGVKGH